MIIRKTPSEIQLMKVAGRIVAQTHQHLKKHIKAGITTKELDEIAETFILAQGAVPSFKNYNDFPASICTSVNEELVHGIPSERTLQDGDIISIDIGAKYKGYHGDGAWTYPVGQVTDEVKHLLEVSEQSLYIGLEQVKSGAKLTNISHAIQTYVEANHYSVVREYVGHGIGVNLHEEPKIANFGLAGQGPTLQTGMVLAIEPMVNYGLRYVTTLVDNWTVVTSDGKLCTHFEHTVAVTDTGFEILTKL